MIELVVRLAFSLAVVLGLLTLLARLSAKRFRGPKDAPIRVVHRQALSRGSAVAVVSVGSRVLVVGTTEQQVSLLTELDPSELDELATADSLDELATLDEPQLAAPEADEEHAFDIEAELAAHRTARKSAQTASSHATLAQGVLAGSALSAQTWRQAFAVATRRQQDAS